MIYYYKSISLIYSNQLTCFNFSCNYNKLTGISNIINNYTPFNICETVSL